MIAPGEHILNALPLPILTIGPKGEVVDANHAAESFFDVSLRVMRRQPLSDLFPSDSPAFALVEEVRRRRSGVSGHRVDLSSPRLGIELLAQRVGALPAPATA